MEMPREESMGISRIGNVKSAVGIKRNHDLSDTQTWDEVAERVG